MSGRQSYNLDDFRKLILQGKTKQEIMLEMGIGIKNLSQFSNLELRLFKKDNKVYEISTKPKNKPVENIIEVGSRGNITISCNVLAQTDFKKGDKFNFKVKDKKIILTLIEEQTKDVTVTQNQTVESTSINEQHKKLSEEK